MPSYKVIKTGHIIEIYEYERTRAKNRKVDYDEEEEYDFDREREETEQTKEIEKADRKDEYRQRTNIRARNTLRRLINANFDNTSLFITLTFAENIQDIPYANREFKKFVQRMKYKQSDFVYCAVIEFQKRGAIHYHMVCNWKATWNNQEELHREENKVAGIWKHGFCDIQPIAHLDNVGAYLIKYMSKDNVDIRLEGKQRYFRSNSLNSPDEIQGEEAIKIIEECMDSIPVFANEYSSEWTGKVKYREYNFKRNGVKISGI